LEFPVVFLFGAEAIPIPATLQNATEGEANWARVLYVGMTRATDLLYITYTRSNRIVDQAAALKAWCELRSYPDDFEF
jgi:superfamily I DNA/RNA helicase